MLWSVFGYPTTYANQLLFSELNKFMKPIGENQIVSKYIEKDKMPDDWLIFQWDVFYVNICHYAIVFGLKTV